MVYPMLLVSFLERATLSYSLHTNTFIRFSQLVPGLMVAAIPSWRFSLALVAFS